LMTQKTGAWAEDFSARVVRVIGVLEVLGALGLVLPELTGVATVLTPLAAAGLVLLHAGALVTHGRRKEKEPIPVNIVLILLAAFVGIGRLLT
jgi:DoxX-like protein